MYMARGQFAAKARYQRVDVSSRVEGATPHELVSMLYEELLRSLDAMALATARGDYVQRGERQSRALRLISGLQTSLDFEQGGDIAMGLARIYREARRLVIAGGREADPAQVTKAREMIAGIAEAWVAIRERA